MPQKVLFIDEAHPVLAAELKTLGFECVLDTWSSAVQIEAVIHEYIGVVLRSRISLSRTFFDKAHALKFVAREGVGLEHIDVAYARRKGVEVLYSPEGSRDTVGEHALGLLLSLMNHLSRADWQVKQGKWLREPNRGVELMGKTVGILGYGNMGSAFAQRLKGFGVEVMAYDKYKTKYGDEHARAVPLDVLFEESDVLSIHIPYSKANHYFIDGNFLQEFRKDIFLVNTARGLVLKTADLVAHLKSGKVRGAALDVLEYEESSFDKFSLETLPPEFTYLSKSENVVLSPHIAGWSFESKRKHAEVLARKIKNLFS
ncbi:MAG: NAD(P)-dependent oxidoreductase [Saprospiraceae bacterium]